MPRVAVTGGMVSNYSQRRKHPLNSKLQNGTFAVLTRGLCSKAREWDSWTVVQPCIWFKEEPSQFSIGQTAQSLTCSIMEKHTWLDECLIILLMCFRARNYGPICPTPSIRNDPLHSHLWLRQTRVGLWRPFGFWVLFWGPPRDTDYIVQESPVRS